MTYKDFKRNIFAIYSENYSGGDVSPIEFGIRRAEFEEAKLCRLIALAEQTDFSTARRKVEGWRRQLEKIRHVKARLEETEAHTKTDRIFLHPSLLLPPRTPLRRVY